MTKPEDDLKTELAALRQEVARFNDHRFVRIENSVLRMLLYQFSRGLAFGLGTVVGASVLVSVVGYFLSQIDFVPILGEWAAAIAERILTEIDGAPPPSR
jgi:hypothetical protein